MNMFFLKFKALEEEIVLREAAFEDSPLLFKWRNDPVTRANSINTEEVKKEEHERWLEKALSNPRLKIYVAERNGEAVGTVRAEHNGSESELSWAVAPEARGQGIGRKMVREALRLTGGVITAKIKAGNQASIRIAASLGFVLQKEEDDLTWWRLRH